MSSKKIAVGIDLGTTFSVVASLDRDGKPVTISNDEGGVSTPSVVYFDSNCTVVGEEAINAAEFLPDRAARFAKRDMGYDVLNKKILGHSFPPEVVLALVLQKLKRDAELKIGKFEKAVITVPAYFNEPRRKATQDAGRMAGIDVLDIINEPTAAAIAFGINAGFMDSSGKARSKERVLVYDLGGGTFDVTLMDIHGRNFDAVATSGDVHLGGMDWDGRIMHHLADQFQNEHGLDPRNEPSSLLKLLQLATRAKKTLSARDVAQVRFAAEGKNSTLSISREQFETLTEDLLERTRMTVRRLLKDSGASWNEVTRLLLVGGSTRMPMIQKMLEVESGLQCDRSLSPDEAVAHGAAVYAQTKLNTDGKPPVFVSNVNSHDLGVLGRDTSTGKKTRQLMIPRNSKLPVTKRRKFVTSKDGQKEVVATVIEGGTETGEGSTKIGKCRVSGLPDELPKGTDVFVTFEYSQDGRLAVKAELPTIDAEAKIKIQRSSGMQESELEYWSRQINEGIEIDSESFSIPTTDKVKSNRRPKAGAKKLAKHSKTTDLLPVARISEPDQAPAKKPPQSKVDIPQFEYHAKAVEESRILVGDEAQATQPSAIDGKLDLATDENHPDKVEESRIIINNESDEKPKPDEHEGLDDFFKKLD